MGQNEDPKDKPYDPLEPFRGMRDAYLGVMAKSMAEVVNTEGYAQATGAVLDNYLTMTGPAKDVLDRSMLQALEQLSLPSRADVLSLAERFTNMEMRIDDMDAKLDQLLQLAKTNAVKVNVPETNAGHTNAVTAGAVEANEAEADAVETNAVETDRAEEGPQEDAQRKAKPLKAAKSSSGRPKQQ